MQIRLLSVLLGMLAIQGTAICLAADADAPSDPEKSTSKADLPASEAAKTAVPLNPKETVLIDAERKRLLLKTRVAQREALLEMLLCKVATKEHETIVAIDADAFVIHSGLLAIGAKPGTPVEYTPEYKPPTGQIIDVYMNWTDEEGKPHREKAQTWIRTVTRRYYVVPMKSLPEGFVMPDKTELRFDPKREELIWFGQMSEAERDRHLALSSNDKFQQAIQTFFKDSQSQEMDADFVFAGSAFFEDEEGKRHYLAESGNIICVANFSDAMIDVATRSTAENADLMYEPYTERIPPLETEVLMELVPRVEK